jgi:DNA-binding HxlR family transcriptional regulator
LSAHPNAMRRLLSSCPAERTLKLLEGRWKIFILHHLFQGEARYAALRRAVQNSAGPVSQKMLTQELRALEGDGLLLRTVTPGKVPNVRYRLTSIGLELRPILEAMVQWGYHYELNKTESVRQPTCLLAEDLIYAQQPQ